MGDWRAPGSFLADSLENFSTKRPDFAAFRPPPCHNGGTQNFEPNFWEIPRCTFQLFHFSRLFRLWDLSWRILWKISVPNAPFSWRLVPPPSATVVRKLSTKLFGKINNSGRGLPAPPNSPVPPASGRRQIIEVLSGGRCPPEPSRSAGLRPATNH